MEWLSFERSLDLLQAVLRFYKDNAHRMNFHHEMLDENSILITPNKKVEIAQNP